MFKHKLQNYKTLRRKYRRKSLEYWTWLRFLKHNIKSTVHRRKNDKLDLIKI